MSENENVSLVEQRRALYRAMGEPPSSQEYLLRLEFNGEPVTVWAPRNWPNENTGD